jgi:hypothetical protein
MTNDKTFAELELQANAMIQTLTSQRNAAQDMAVNLVGQIAILEKRIEALTEKAQTADVPKAEVATAA